jgi:hypothetical protein
MSHFLYDKEFGALPSSVDLAASSKVVLYDREKVGHIIAVVKELRYIHSVLVLAHTKKNRHIHKRSNP